MSAPLLSASEIASVREVAESGMQTTVAVWTRGTVKTVDGWEATYTLTSTILGWLFSTPTPVQTEVSGKQTTVNTYRLFLPIGSAIVPGDHAVIGAKTFVVSDVNEESTWLAMLTVSLRFAE